MQKEGKEVYHLAFGQSPFPIPGCFVSALKEFAHKHEYLPVAGIKIWLRSFKFESNQSM